MRAVTKVTVYVAGLGVAFAGAFGVGTLTGSPVGPPAEPGTHASGDHDATGHDGTDQGDAGQGDAGPETAADATNLAGLQTSAEGYHVSPVDAPASVGEPGTLSFHIVGPDGDPVTAFAESHEELLHLIVVRSDTAHYYHVHPALGPDGTWTVDWEWPAAGTYRVFADFTPDAFGNGITLTRTVEVAGDYQPSGPPAPATVAEINEFTVTLDGDLRAGTATPVTATVTRGGKPVTDLEPFLGALGHLVALREGDLAYVHVHPEHGSAANPGEIPFHIEPPTAGTYRLFLEFQVAGEVHVAEFTVSASQS